MEPVWVFWPAELLIAISLTPTTLLLLLLQLIPHIETTVHTVKEPDKKSVATWHLVYAFLPRKRQRSNQDDINLSNRATPLTY